MPSCRLNGALAAVEIPPADRSQPLPLSHAQERLWFLDQFEDNLTAYNMPFALRLRGALDHGRTRTDAASRLCAAMKCCARSL